MTFSYYAIVRTRQALAALLQRLVGASTFPMKSFKNLVF
jgi:hypothetical protein